MEDIAVKENYLPSDLGRIEDCWWLLVKVIDYFSSSDKGLTLPEVKKNLKRVLHAIHEKSNNSDFSFFLGYEQTIPTVLDNMIALRRVTYTNPIIRYHLTDNGRKTLQEREEEIANYCGIESLDALLTDIKEDFVN